MSESSNQPFDHDKHINHVIAPEKSTSTGGTPPTPENKKRKIPLKWKIVSGVAGLALAGGGISWAVASAGEAPAKASHSTSAPSHPTHTSEASPSATPTATPEATTEPNANSYNYNLTQADVSTLLAESPDQLNSNSLSDKAEILEYYAQTLPAFSQDWYAVSQDQGDILPATVNKDNTPAEINAFVTMQTRQAMTLNGADGFHLDEAAATNYLSAQYVNGTLSPAYKDLATFASQSGGASRAPDARALAVSHYLTIPTINHSSAKYTDTAGNLCIDMNRSGVLTSASGDSIVTTDQTICLITNKFGSVWMTK